MFWFQLDSEAYEIFQKILEKISKSKIAHFVCKAVYREIRLISRVKAQGGRKIRFSRLWGRKIVEMD